MQPFYIVMHLITDLPHIHRVMKQMPNFSISSLSTISSFFIKRNIRDSFSAIRHLSALPLTMQGSSESLLQVAENGGTANAKNALLALLALENNQPTIKLTLCTYAVDFASNPLLQCVLDKHNLPALPEVGCYLKYQGTFYTIAKESLQVTQPVISDIEITPQQIGSFAQRYYQHFAEHWLQLEKLHHIWTVDKIKIVKQECLQVMKTCPWQLMHSPLSI